MRIAILYGSPIKLTNAHKLVSHSGGPLAHGATPQPPYYVRMDTKHLNGDDLAESFSLVKPMDGETFLNTVPLP